MSAGKVDVLAVMQATLAQATNRLNCAEIAQANESVAAVKLLIHMHGKQADALETIILILENYRDASDFSARLDGWLQVHAYDAVTAHALLARIGGDA